MRSGKRVLFAFDETYAPPGLVAMHTAMIQSPATVDVTVASVGLSSETTGRIRKEAECHARDVSIVEAEELVDALPSGLPRFSPAAWARVFIDRIIPEDTDRVVYLDADTFCRRPIHELFEIDLGPSPLAAVPDPIEPTHELRGAEYWRAAATRPSSGYFNSGVMVVDRSAWVERDVTGRALRMIATRRVPTRSVDQDILNAVLWEQWLPLPSIWNTLGSASGAYRDARIVHFMGDHKPWRGSDGGGPFVEEYRREVAGVGSV
jgi:lipopolysaccharide biosynthesis glycosyltransferase